MSNYHITQEQAIILAETHADESYSRGMKHQTVNEIVYVFTKDQLQDYTNAVLDRVLGEPVGAIWENTDYGKGEVTGHFIGKINDKQPKFIKLTKLYAPKEQS